MATDRPKVPADRKRVIRRACGFGCAVCGLPIYQYHHIIPWRLEAHFRPEDMMLLCPLHHDAATKGALTEEQQRSARAEPRNIREGQVRGTLTINQTHLAVRIGGVLLVGDGPLVSVDKEPLLRTEIDDGRLVISVALFNQADKLIARIDRNEWITGDPLPWDIQSDHQKLKVRSKLYDVRLDLNASRIPAAIKGKLWRRGACIQLRPARVCIDTKAASKVGVSDLALVGMGLDVRSGGTPRLAPMGTGGALVSESDPTRRLAKALNAWQGLQSGETASVEIRPRLGNSATEHRSGVWC